MPEFGCAPGLALDLTTTDPDGNPWDFSQKKQRDKAEALLDTERPALLIGSPMCTQFSQWLNISAAKRDLSYKPRRSINESLEALRHAYDREQALKERGEDGGAT